MISPERVEAIERFADIAGKVLMGIALAVASGVIVYGLIVVD